MSFVSAATDLEQRYYLYALYSPKAHRKSLQAEVTVALQMMGYQKIHLPIISV